jgi:hypothetical protein
MGRGLEATGRDELLHGQSGARWAVDREGGGMGATDLF